MVSTSRPTTILKKRYPLFVMLHGGSSNGNLFLGVLLGNNLDWKSYNQHLYDPFVPRWKPDAIVVAPTGFGQIIWRWLGEEDVFAVIDDVMRTYSVDHDRIVLGGVSNGGMGAYTIGSRHAWRFAAVHAMAGAPSWKQYVRQKLRPWEEIELDRISALSLIDNTNNTHFYAYHGRTDTGPMRPKYFQTLVDTVSGADELKLKTIWYDLGHDILYRTLRMGRAYQTMSEQAQLASPDRVVVVSGDCRATRQHWLEIEKFERDRYPRLARIEGRYYTKRGPGNGARQLSIELQTQGVKQLSVRLSAIRPDEKVRSLSVEVNKKKFLFPTHTQAGDSLHFTQEKGAWLLGFSREVAGTKSCALSGPFTDASSGEIVHVYGTKGDERTTRSLKRAAERGARGFALWAWDVNQKVISDTEFLGGDFNDKHVAIYATPGSNAAYDALTDQPFSPTPDGVTAKTSDSEKTFAGAGVRYVFPRSEHTYYLITLAPTPELVRAASKLPEFLPDYIVYDAKTLGRQQGRVLGKRPARAGGYFLDDWSLPGSDTP